MLDLLLVVWLTCCAFGGLILHKIDCIAGGQNYKEQNGDNNANATNTSVLEGFTKKPRQVEPYEEQLMIDAFRALAKSKLRQ